MNRHLCSAAAVAALGLAFVLPSVCHAQGDTAFPSVHMTAFSNSGSLTATKRMTIWVNTDYATLPYTTYTYPAAPGSTSSENGQTYAELKNNTGSSITISDPSPSITIKAYTSTNNAGASAGSFMSLGAVYSASSCYGTGGSHSDPQGVTFHIISVAPGNKVYKEGDWDAHANGG